MRGVIDTGHQFVAAGGGVAPTSPPAPTPRCLRPSPAAAEFSSSAPPKTKMNKSDATCPFRSRGRRAVPVPARPGPARPGVPGVPGVWAAGAALVMAEGSRYIHRPSRNHCTVGELETCWCSSLARSPRPATTRRGEGGTERNQATASHNQTIKHNALGRDTNRDAPPSGHGGHDLQEDMQPPCSTT